MMKIHSIIWLLIGLLVSIVSQIANNASLRFFFYVGLLFIAIGFIKAVVSYLTPKPEKKQTHKLGLLHHPQYHQKIAEEHPQAYTKYCARCRQQARSIDNFCSRCGSRWFHRHNLK